MLLLWLAGPVPNIDSKAVCSRVQRIEPPVAKEAMERIVVSLEPRLSVWVQTSTAEGDDYEHSSVLWASAFVATRWLAHDGRCRGKRVMELGAGCGLVGLSIAALSAPKSTMLTDLHHAVPALRRAIAKNGWYPQR